MNLIATQRICLTVDLRASRYDRISSFLVATIAILGVLVFLMFLNWLSASYQEFMKSGTTMGGAMVGMESDQTADDWLVPGQTEFSETRSYDLAGGLQAVTDAVSRLSTQLQLADGAGAGGLAGTGNGDGRKGRQGLIDPDPRDPEIPEAGRWKVRISASNPHDYLTILDHFDITIGVVSQLSNKISYVNGLQDDSPVVSDGERKDEARFFFINTRNRLRQWDKNKAEASNIDLTNTMVGHFYPARLQTRLRELEAAVYQAEGKTLPEVKQTQFRVRPAAGGYEYYVESIEYRPRPDND